MFIRQKHKNQTTLAKDYPLRGSESDEYETPDEVFAYYDRLYHFYCDVCASRRMHKVRRYFTSDIDALKQHWIGCCWMNPPYSNIRAWTEKAWQESLQGATVIGLLPVWTGDAWFHEFVVPHAHITLLKYRLRFRGPTSKGFQATFPSMVCVWPREAAISPPTVNVSPSISMIRPPPELSHKTFERLGYDFLTSVAEGGLTVVQEVKWRIVLD